MNGNTNTNATVSYPTPEEINPFHDIKSDSDNGTNQQSKETNPFLQTPTPTSNPHPTPIAANPFYQPQPQPQPADPPVSAEATEAPKETGQAATHETQSKSEEKRQADDLAAAGPSCSTPQPPAYDESAEKWGTHVMGHPAVPTCHPGNKKAALWGAPSEEAQRLHYPYLQYSPVERSNNTSGGGGGQSILHVFNSWSNKAETMANNIWHNRNSFSFLSFPFLSIK